MRYSEFIAESKDAESILANVMQLAIKTADEDGVPAKASWDELSRMLNAFGMQIDYDSFKEIYDKSQTIKILRKILIADKSHSQRKQMMTMALKKLQMFLAQIE